jgi:hypothetical protein
MKLFDMDLKILDMYGYKEYDLNYKDKIIGRIRLPKTLEHNNNFYDYSWMK